MGKLKKKASSDRETSSPNARPLKVIFHSVAKRNEVVRTYWSMKNDGSSQRYGLSNDFTKSETERYLKLKKDLKAKQDKGEHNWKIYTEVD